MPRPNMRLSAHPMSAHSELHNKGVPARNLASDGCKEPGFDSGKWKSCSQTTPI
jgi:hypothetical protein